MGAVIKQGEACRLTILSERKENDMQIYKSFQKLLGHLCIMSYSEGVVLSFICLKFYFKQRWDFPLWIFLISIPAMTSYIALKSPNSMKKVLMFFIVGFVGIPIFQMIVKLSLLFVWDSIYSCLIIMIIPAFAPVFLFEILIRLGIFRCGDESLGNLREKGLKTAAVSVASLFILFFAASLDITYIPLQYEFFILGLPVVLYQYIDVNGLISRLLYWLFSISFVVWLSIIAANIGATAARGGERCSSPSYSIAEFHWASLLFVVLPSIIVTVTIGTIIINIIVSLPRKLK